MAIFSEVLAGFDCDITFNGRIVCLNAYAKYFNDENNLESKCPIHAPSNEGEGWAEKEADYDPLEEDSIDGVPLEHLVSAVKGVQIVSNSSGIKSIVLVSPEEEVCDIDDLLHEISETSVAVSKSGDDIMIEVPKREQTLDELERTQTFADECKKLLRHAPECRIAFNKFIPSYHHHFGRQCRVSDYGFSKLMELFESIPHMVDITEDSDGERLIQLTDSIRLSVVGDQIKELIRDTPNQTLTVDDMERRYKSLFGKVLDLKKVACDLPDLVELLDALQDQDDVNNNDDNNNEPGEEMLNSAGARSIRLVPLQLCVARITELIKEHDKLYCSDLEALFAEKYKTALSPGQYGYPNIKNLLESGLSKHFTIRGRGSRKVICVAKEMPEKSQDSSTMSSYFNSAPMPHFRRDGDSSNQHHSRHGSSRTDRGVVGNDNFHGLSLNRAPMGLEAASRYL
ncbi:hypothetical protein TCAL_13813 [Tigriopus californicus]|uniref:HTH OST-type domain-containing protein n=1 Tax=Tigriopus californicus TaxID=6832 RepID=A0A553PTI6_TIGCA|nr:hypothetical protein TCAL_13813 [Tigriopus californicus]|eukprot:TCALIF_13813-PA protein Name:"Similar to MARF1 Meiosis arrest female protein 1 (Bos taurus)" AED:0.36 eAED:0.36 QI:0/0.16/0/0.28/1/1/7/0/454